MSFGGWALSGAVKEHSPDSLAVAGENVEMKKEKEGGRQGKEGKGKLRHEVSL